MKYTNTTVARIRRDSVPFETCPDCWGRGYTKSAWRPGSVMFDGKFKWCRACKRSGVIVAEKR